MHPIVFGATGDVGSEVTKSLAAAYPGAVTVTVRGATPADAGKAARLEHFEGVTIVQADVSSASVDEFA